MKYLRWLGYDFQYFVTGENGSLKGRAHWHFILHFTGKVPEVLLGKNFSDRHKNEDGKLYDFDVCKAWPHGFMYWKKAQYEDVFYNCKYILKDEDDENSQRKPGLSKKPPIGALYFEKVAEQAVVQGIAPQTLEYRFPEIKQKETKEPVLFYLQGRSAELYLDHFIKTWAEQRGEQPRPKSELVDLYEQYGQIVHDEKALLIRREFPQSESRQRMPTGQEIKAGAKQAEAELAVWQQQENAFEREEWWTEWVASAKNEQERQKRQAQWERYLHEQDSERRECGEQSSGVGGQQQPDQQPEPVDAGRTGPDTGAGARREYGPGRVGRWNHHYGTKAGSDASSA